MNGTKFIMDVNSDIVKKNKTIFDSNEVKKEFNCNRFWEKSKNNYSARIAFH